MTVFCCDYLCHSNHFVDNFGNFKKGLYVSKLVALRNLPYALSNFPILKEMGSRKEVLGSFSHIFRTSVYENTLNWLHWKASERFYTYMFLKISHYDDIFSIKASLIVARNTLKTKLFKQRKPGPQRKLWTDITGQVNSQESPETPEIKEITENFTEVTNNLRVH